MLQSEKDQRAFIDRFSPKVFAFVLNLIGGDRDKAYDIAASSFAEVLSAKYPRDDEGCLAALVRSALEQNRTTDAVPDFDERDPSMRVVRTALVSLSVEEKTLVLLRDQMNMGYSQIASLLSLPEKEVRNRTTQARSQLRKKVGESLRRVQ